MLFLLLKCLISKAESLSYGIAFYLEYNSNLEKKMINIAPSFDSLELVVGLDELLNKSLTSLRVRQHCSQSLPYLTSGFLVQQNQI